MWCLFFREKIDVLKLRLILFFIWLMYEIITVIKIVLFTCDFFLLTHSSNCPHKFCLVVYHIPEGFKPTLSSHGNSKSGKPFYPTWPSTLTNVKKECGTQGPKATVEHLSSIAGGVLGASAQGELPRDEKQVTNMKKRKKIADKSGGDALVQSSE